MTTAIVNGRLKDARFVKANSYGGDLKPSLIVCHDTAGRLEKFNSVSWFASKQCKTSAHVVVERDGTITQMVPFNKRAFHAGQSSWQKKQFCNSFAIGIEIVNPGMMEKRGEEACLIYRDKNSERIVSRFPIAQCQEVKTKAHGHGWCLPYTPEQIAAVKKLCRALVEEYEDANEIVTHYLISPGRKVDTNPLFPLEEVRAYAFGHEEEAPVAPPALPVPGGAGAVAGSSAATVKALISVSRKASWLSRLTKTLHAIWGSLTIAAILDTLGFAKETIASIEQVIENNAIAIAIGGSILGALALKYVLARMAEDVAEGRYTPSGETASS